MWCVHHCSDAYVTDLKRTSHSSDASYYYITYMTHTIDAYVTLYAYVRHVNAARCATLHAARCTLHAAISDERRNDAMVGTISDKRRNDAMVGAISDKRRNDATQRRNGGNNNC